MLVARLVGPLAVVLACGVGCKGDSGGSPSPTPNPGGGTSGTTITITSAGTSPRNLTVSRGSQVTFTNNDSRPHEMNSDPHPTHGECPELDQVGFLSPGQSRQTGNLNTVRNCGYHDHNNFPNASLQGTITIQ
jgi:plastocyanin